MGIFINDVRLDYPEGTLLDVGFLGFDNLYHIDGQRFSMVVTNTDENGTGLKLVNYKIDNLNRWKSVLSTVFNIQAERALVKDQYKNTLYGRTLSNVSR